MQYRHLGDTGCEVIQFNKYIFYILFPMKVDFDNLPHEIGEIYLPKHSNNVFSTFSAF